MGAEITVNVSLNNKRLKRKLDSLLESNTTRVELHNLLAKTVNPWVPMLEGPLSQNIEITPEYVRYLQPYARRQYYGVDFNHTRDYHPLASAMWDKAAMQVKGEEFATEVENILKRRAKENG